MSDLPKHGLTFRDVVLLEDGREAFAHLQESLEAELQPQGALEQDLFQQLVVAAWNLRRVRRLEAKLVPDVSDPLLDDMAEATLARLARHQVRFERSYFRCLRELRLLQTNRALRSFTQKAPREPLPVLASVAEITKRTHSPNFPSPANRALSEFERETELLMARGSPPPEPDAC